MVWSEPHTSPPTATNDPPEVATTLGENLGDKSETFWFDRITSMVLISATKTEESSATAIDLGCEVVETDACLVSQSVKQYM